MGASDRLRCLVAGGVLMEIEALSLTTVSSVAVLLAATTVVTAIVERMTGATRLSAMTVIAGER